jgi:hypothetical protein
MLRLQAKHDIATLSSDVENVAKALGADQCNPRQISLDQRVGDNSSAIDHRLDFPKRQVKRL